MCNELESFKEKNLFQRMVMPLPELENYYRERREVFFKRGEKLKHIHLRKYSKFITMIFLLLDRFFKKHTITLLGDSAKQLNQIQPTIFACTHIGGDDISRLFEAIKSHCYLFLGDPKGLYRDLAGLLLFLNGCICAETSDKTDRKIAYLRAVELLKAGGSLMIFPEGAWNITDNLPVMHLFNGTAKMARETTAQIVPIAIEQYGNRFVINAGSPILPMKFQTDNSLTQYLRDALSTLKWEIWEHEGLTSRESLGSFSNGSFADEIVARCPYGYDFSIDDVKRTCYHTKDTSPDEAFEYLKILQRKCTEKLSK